MKKKFIWLVVSCLMTISLVLSSCGEAEEEEEEEVVIPPGEEEEVVIPPEEEEEVKPPTGGNWWDKLGEPEYGGTFTFRITSGTSNFDPYRASDWPKITDLYMEKIAFQDWTLDRNIWSYQGVWVPPERYAPCLAESWEQPDFETVIIHVRPGVHWHDKPPMNGRELTAYDIQWSWDRLTGMGSGFTEPSPWVWAGNYKVLKSLTATDKYTLEFKSIAPSLQLIQTATETYFNLIMPREVVEMYGNLEDWQNACGTGPWMLKDYVEETSAALTKNPNYWGHDERHPQNQVPYVDGLKLLVIPDISTTYAALRTGKIDMVRDVAWEQAESLLNTNPELQSAQFLLNGSGIQPIITQKPWDDIRVRKAINMALDRKTITETYYGGLVEESIYPYFSPLVGDDLYVPFEEWPPELQEGYSYNPAGAKALLAEAGYPNGFQTNVVVSSASNLDLVQVIQSYFADIGIELEIKVVEAAAFWSYVIVNKKADQMYMGLGTCNSNDPGPFLDYFTGGHFANAAYVADDWCKDTLYQASISTDWDEVYRLWRATDRHIMEEYWLCSLPPAVSFTVWQPWLKGYSGESLSRFEDQQYARWWIDQDVKKSMGY